MSSFTLRHSEGGGEDSLIWIDEWVVNQVSVDVHGHLADLSSGSASSAMIQYGEACRDRV